jgi:c(7)-type cytochrome triheme protein
MKTTRIQTKWAAMLLCAGLATAVSAADLKDLPADQDLPQGEESPGKVTFSHSSHVDATKPACTTCHPATFRILEKGATADGAKITHASMEKGAQCGVCHGKAAFGFDDCTMCHQ